MMRFSSLAVVFFLLFFPASAQRGELLWSEDTDWGQVRVRQQGHERTLLFADQQGETEESRIDVRAPHRPVQRYLRQMLAATALWESQGESAWPPDGPSKPLKFLVVGLGGGSLSNALCHLFPEATVVSVDIEPAVVEAARRYFFLREDERSRVVIEDARRLLESSPESYDIIYLDAFDGLEVPAPLRTVEFAQLLESRLRPGGAVIANVHLVPELPSLRYQRAMLEALPQQRMFAGVAQRTGLFTRQPLQLKALSAELSKRYQLPLESLLEPARVDPLDGVEPFRDNDGDG